MIDLNPVQGVKRFPDKRHDRFLSQIELVALGEALRDAVQAQENPAGIAILRLLIFTGARKSEIARLRWSEVDFEHRMLRFSDSKTGQKILPLNAAALAVLAEHPKLEGQGFVFPALRGGGHYVGTPKVWNRVRAAAGLEDVRLHDLRHSFASVAVSMGASLPMIGALLGHKDSATTQRYAHLSDDPIRSVSDAVSKLIGNAMQPVA